MFTVTTEDGHPKVNVLGHVVFTRTLAEARAQMVPGDSVITWSNSGAPLLTRKMDAAGRLQVRPVRRASLRYAVTR